MRLTVRVIEARNLQAMDSNGFSDPYVKLQLGKQRFKTKVIKMNLNPTWDQEFSFLVGDVKDVLKLDVYDEDILQMDDFLGQLRVPLEDVLVPGGTSFFPRAKPTRRSIVVMMHIHLVLLLIFVLFCYVQPCIFLCS